MAKHPLNSQKDEDFRLLTVEDLMTSEVFAFTPMTTVSDAINIIITKKISGAPIVDQANRVVSVVSESDLIKFAALGGMDKTLGDFEAKLVKKESLVTVKRSDRFVDIFKKFLDYPVRRVLVVDSNGKLQGIVSRSNILKAFIKTKKTSGQAA
jgi:predicted transcriptional regulator